MFDLPEWLKISPFSLNQQTKTAALTTALKELTVHHYHNFNPYRNILKAQGFDPDKIFSYIDLPFLPVNLFKKLDLVSVPREDIIKTMTSSGTTGQ